MVARRGIDMHGGLFKKQHPRKMKTKEITINGQTYPITFTIKTLMGYEDITKKKFFRKDNRLESLSDKVALVYASIIAADDKAQITIDEMMNADKMEILNDIINAFNELDAMASEFFRVPAVEPQQVKTEDEDEGGDNSKN